MPGIAAGAEKPAHFSEGEYLGMILLNARIRNLDHQIESTDDFAAIIFDTADTQVNRRRRQALFVAGINQKRLDLIGRTIFRSFLEVEHEIAKTSQVVLAGSPGVIAKGHMVVHPFEGFIKSSYAGSAPGGLFLVVVIMVDLIVKQKT